MSAPTLDGVENELSPAERYWRDQYTWLLREGYQLRRRYDPQWVPSWVKDTRIFPPSAEDAQPLQVPSVIDAVQVSTNRHVVLKRISKKKNPDELRILQYFGQPELADDSRNHCTPLIATLAHPDDEDTEIYVMPVLRQFDDPPFDTVGEAVDFLRQILEGFVFLHEHRVAHRDIKGDNILLDPTAMGFVDFHFIRPDRMANNYDRRIKAKHTRTERRPKYYITDFGYSTLYAQDQSPWPPMEPQKPASDLSLPEISNEQWNPFPADVYYVGNWMRMEFIIGDARNWKKPGYVESFDFLLPLIDAMTKENPSDRVTMPEALAQFEQIISSLSTSTIATWRMMTAAPVSREEYPVNVRLTRAVQHLLRRFKYVLLRLPPVPSAPPSPVPASKTLPEASHPGSPEGELLVVSKVSGVEVGNATKTAPEDVDPEVTKSNSRPRTPTINVNPSSKPIGASESTDEGTLTSHDPTPTITVSIPTSTL